MIITSTDQVVPFTPPWRDAAAVDADTQYNRTIELLTKAHKKDPDAFERGKAEAEKQRLINKNPPKFFLRAGGVIERGNMEAELAGIYRAGKVYGFELREAIRNGIRALLGDDPEVEHLLELVNSEGGDQVAEVSDNDKRLLAEARAILAEHWPEYRDLLAQLSRRNTLAPIVALRRYCTGWEHCTGNTGKPVVFARGRDGQVTEAALSGLSELEMLVAGNRAYALQFADGDEGNSPPPSSSEDGQATSSSDGTSTAAG